MSESPLRTAAGLLIAVVVILLILGHVLGQPILLSYVATGSMEPAIEEGDGFVAIPSVVAGPIEEGDVITYQARTLHDGGLTTHRVVRVTDNGYVTKGDANPFTDQDGGEPTVTDGQVVAVALQLGGQVVTIPELGTAVMGFQGFLLGIADGVGTIVGIPAALSGGGVGAMLVAFGIAMLGLGVLIERTGAAQRARKRSRRRPNVLQIWVIVAVALFVLVGLSTAAMVIPGGVYEYELMSTEDPPSDNPQIIAPGESTTLDRPVHNDGLVPIVVVHEAASAGVAVEPRVQTMGMRDRTETTVTLTAPAEETRTLRSVSEYRYLMLLPPSMIVWFHDVNPLLAIGAVNGVIVTVVVVAILLIFGKGELRLRSRRSDAPPAIRARRMLQRWF